MKIKTISAPDAAKLKETELGPLPEEWRVVRLGRWLLFKVESVKKTGLNLLARFSVLVESISPMMEGLTFLPPNMC